jgi:hypothetical protein
MKMKEEQILSDSGTVFVRTWFANGHPRGEGMTTKYGKKTGNRKQWNKDGEFLGITKHKQIKPRDERSK